MKKLQFNFNKDYEQVKKSADALDLIKIIDKQQTVIKAGLEVSELRQIDKTDEWKRVADIVTNEAIDEKIERDVVATWKEEEGKSRYIMACIQSLRNQPNNSQPDSVSQVY